MPQPDPQPERGGASPEVVRPGALSALLQELVRAPGPAGEDGASSLRPGARVGRFEIVRELGRGGFGVVYEARDTELGRTVAFKALHPGARPEVREERLLREAEAAARLAHPNIVTLYDVGRTEHGPFLVMELLRGRTLADRLRQGALPLREALRVGAEVARALAHAHAHGVVHRDLTAGNVFLCEDGRVKVLDLGLAHAFGRRKLDGGTPGAMAPEQRRGAPEDERTDVFALGVLLHRMLSGQPPYPGDGERPAPWARRPPELVTPEAPALGGLVARMLAQDPVERPRDAAEVLEALDAFQDELARTPSTGRSAPVRARRRTPWRVALAVAMGVAVGAAAALLARRPGGEQGPAPSIAVLPFADLSPQRDQGWFSDGLSEEIINALAQVDGLHVSGRTSSFAFRGRSDDLRAIGQQLRVATVLEGSVRRAGNRVRITAQVIDLASGYHLWSETFDRQLDDIFAVQDEIARAVAAALRVKLLPARLAAAAAREHRTTRPEVYGHYLLARQHYARFDADGFRRALEEYEKALALDPEFAPAWSGLAIQLSNLMDHPEARAEAPSVPERALAAAERAIALDPELAEGYAARSLLRGSVRWDWAGARADMDRALALASGDANTQRRYGVLLSMLGRHEEAIEATRRAIEIDPLFAGNWVNLFDDYLSAGQLAAARAALDRVHEMLPGERRTGDEALLLVLEGKPAEALPLLAEDQDEEHRLLTTAAVQHAMKDDAAVQATLAKLLARGERTSPTSLAIVYACLGDLDRAMEWMERAYERRDRNLTGIRSKERLIPGLREDPRYQALLRKMGLADAA